MQQLLFDNINKFASLEALHIEYFLFPNIINATHATTQCNNYHLTKCTHVPRRPCLLLKCMQNYMSLVKIVDNVDLLSISEHAHVLDMHRPWISNGGE